MRHQLRATLLLRKRCKKSSVFLNQQKESTCHIVIQRGLFLRPEGFFGALIKKNIYAYKSDSIISLPKLFFRISNIAGLPRFTTCTKTRLLQLCVVCVHEGFLLLRLQGLVALKKEEGRFQMITQRRERKIWELFLPPRRVLEQEDCE